jgi:hypothetical protein
MIGILEPHFAVTYHIFLNKQGNLYLFCCLQQGFTTPGYQVAIVIEFCMVVLIFVGLQYGSCFFVTILVSRIFRWLLDFLIICTPLASFEFMTAEK